MSNIIQKKPHVLHDCKNKDELRKVLSDYKIDLDEIVNVFIKEDAVYCSMVVGSISEGLATSVSDLDILVFIDDESLFLDGVNFVSGVPVVNVVGGTKGWFRQVLIVKSGVEINIDFVVPKGFSSLIGALSPENSSQSLFQAYDLSPRDILYLDRLRSGWVLTGSKNAEKWRKSFCVDQLCSVMVKQYFILSVENFEDVIAAKDSAKGLVAHLGRISVEHGMRSLLATTGFVSQTDKWLRKIDFHLSRNEALDHELLEYGRRLMFPNILCSVEEQHRYIVDVAEFITKAGHEISKCTDLNHVVSLMLDKIQVD